MAHETSSPRPDPAPSDGAPLRRRSLRWFLSFPFRVAILVALIVFFSAVLPMLPVLSGLAYWAQAATLGCLGVAFLVIYRGFLPDLLRYLVDHPGQALILILLLAILYGVIGVAYGLPDLFWNEYPAARFLSALGVTLLLGTLGTNAFYLDRRARDNTTRIREFLQRRGVRYRDPADPGRFDPVPGTNSERGGWFLRLARLPMRILAALPALFPDPLPETNSERVGLFLRLARLPMLTLVSLPALFPLVFPYVPRVAPIGEFKRVFFLEPRGATAGGDIGLIDRLNLPDVAHNGWAWLLGVICWGGGLVAGILLVKLLLRANSWVERGHADPEPASLRAPSLLRRMFEGATRIVVLPLKLLEAVIGYATRQDPSPARRLLEGVILLAAVGLTFVDAVTGIATQAEASFLPSLLFLLDLTALLVAAVLGHRLALRLHPGLWPRFARFIRIFAVVLIGLILWDQAVEWCSAWFAGIWWLSWISRMAVPSGMALCVLLAVLAMVGAWLHLLRTESDAEGQWAKPGVRRVRWALPVFLGLVAWVGLVNNQDYKLRFPHLDYRSPVDLKIRVPAAYSEELGHEELGAEAQRERPVPPRLVTDEEALKAWLPVARAAQQRDKPKLVIVCASGGASRSAYWTAIVLDRLGRDLPGFDEGVRVITGASGGMVGAAYYARWRHGVAIERDLHAAGKGAAGAPPGGEGRRGPEPPSEWVAASEWVAQMKNKSLVRIASFIALEELPRMLLPRFPFGDRDRGSVLDADWAPQLDVRLSSLCKHERQGVVPSLIFTPVIVDDGRRLFVSNLDLGKLAIHRGDELHPAPVPAVEDQGRNGELAIHRGDELHAEDNAPRAYSLAGLEFFKLFRDNGADELRLSTAARMSATFPFVSPAVNLPSKPPLRLVDAGYYDNYGVNLATAWIAQNWKKLHKEVSGILLVQVRAFVGRGPRLAPPAKPSGLVASLLRGAQFFTSPLDAFGSGRYTGSVFRNDEELAALMEVINGEMEVIYGEDGRDFFTTVVFENTSRVLIEPIGRQPAWPGLRVDPKNIAEADLNTEVAMTWYVSQVEERAMQLAIPSDGVASRTLYEDEWHEDAPPRTLNDPPDRKLRRSFFDRPTDRLNWLQFLLDQRQAEKLAPALRASYEKEFERALNYERIQAIRAWWCGGPRGPIPAGAEGVGRVDRAPPPIGQVPAGGRR